SATRNQFTEDVFTNVIEGKILAAFERRLGHATSKREVESWKNSMQYMNNVLVGYGIPEDAGCSHRVQDSAHREVRRLHLDGLRCRRKRERGDRRAQAVVGGRGDREGCRRRDRDQRREERGPASLVSGVDLRGADSGFQRDR